ncbi:DUF2851 family protein [uncultured Prevotella sp.]|uniref:DUF2851 family protein n=1 Tax=uncultured Prevotella sp. TaxID=159272 RepID=UPI0026763DCC|nr:DUF2851 family protein [uncultured Prevotella sp.]
MEQLLHYIWKHRILPLHELRTTDGRAVEIIDPGLHNTHSGPDFFNAKLRIDGTMWVGNVEIHERSADWFMHSHDQDPAYNNVVLHVASVIDADVVTADGSRPPQMELHVPPYVMQNYRRLLAADHYPPCRETVMQLPRLTVHSWMSALGAERLSDKCAAIEQRVRAAGGSWEQAFFATIARSFGFGVNSEAFEQWAAQLPFMQVAHHRDDSFQVEALFIGFAGLLDTEAMTDRQRTAATADPYFVRLKSEWEYLAHKFSLTAMPRQTWRFLRLRPQNFPYIRLSQLAQLYCSRHADLSRIVTCASLSDMREALQTEVSSYWRTHYTFGNESRSNAKHLSSASIDLLIINAIVPMLYAYGRHRKDELLMARANDLLQSLPPEDNTHIRLWQECGITADNAADTQSLIQLHARYCERKDCLRCRFGYWELRSKQ